VRGSARCRFVFRKPALPAAVERRNGKTAWHIAQQFGKFQRCAALPMEMAEGWYGPGDIFGHGELGVDARTSHADKVHVITFCAGKDVFRFA